jgi:hypothetical protein
VEHGHRVLEARLGGGGAGDGEYDAAEPRGVVMVLVLLGREGRAERDQGGGGEATELGRARGGELHKRPRVKLI